MKSMIWEEQLPGAAKQMPEPHDLFSTMEIAQTHER